MAINPSRATLNKYIHLTYLFKLHTMKRVFLIYQSQRRFKLQKSLERRRGKGACKNGQGFRFQNAGNLCHIQIHCMSHKHNNNTTTTYFKYITQVWSLVKPFFVQNKKICQFVKYLADQTAYALLNDVYGNRISCRSYRFRFLLLIYIKIARGAQFTG